MGASARTWPWSCSCRQPTERQTPSDGRYVYVAIGTVSRGTKTVARSESGRESAWQNLSKRRRHAAEVERRYDVRLNALRKAVEE